MEQFPNHFRPGPSVPECVRILSAAPVGSENAKFELHFNQNEELFLRLPKTFVVPSIPIHHDVRRPGPAPDYLRGLCLFLEAIVPAMPRAFEGLRYFFDPSDPFHPGFYRLHEAEGARYLFILRLDLGYRPNAHRVLRPGDNDRTAEYETRDLYVESEFIPLSSVENEGSEAISFQVEELISQTWIGETGKGYMIRGIWMDADLSKFFTKLFLPELRSVYPYFPLFCKYKTVCAAPLRFDAEGRQGILPDFHRNIEFLRPWIDGIQKALKRSDFSDTMREFTELRRRVPESWLRSWTGPKISAYLNEADLKEYLVEY
jgi:hypothetical protein